MRHVDFDGTGRIHHTSAALTDLDVQVLVRPDDLTPASAQFIVGEYLTTGNKRGWFIRINTDGTIRLQWSNDGTATLSMDSTVSLDVGYDNGDKFWVRATLDVNDGGGNRVGRFYTSDNGTVWTQLGATVTTAGTTSVFHDNSTVITMGGDPVGTTFFTGKVYAVRLYSAIGGSTNLVDPDPWDWSNTLWGATGLTYSTPALSATEQDVYPPRVLLSATDLELDDTVTLYRDLAGTSTVVRGADSVEANDPSLVKIDAEQPFDVLLTYRMVINDEEEYTDTITVTLPGGKVAVSDAITGQAAEVVISAWPTRRTARRGSVYAVGGRTVAVSGPRAGTEGTIQVVTESNSARENFEDLLTNATSGILQIRMTQAAYPSGEMYSGPASLYVYVTEDSEERWSQDGSDPRRLWNLSVIEVEPWAATLEALGYTYQDLADSYVGQTYADLAGDFDTYLELAQGDFGV